VAVGATVTRVRIFVASPGDVASERSQLDNVVAELNLMLPALAPDKHLTLDLVKWEKSVAPGLGRDAQDVVNQQIGDYDIFVGILWKRMGTPTAVALSGTEEEYQRAYASWQQDKKLPILFYFSQEPYSIKTREENEQLGRVLAFRDELSKHGLVWDYSGASGFADVIRPHLALVLGRMFSNRSAQEAVESIQKLGPSPGRAVTERNISKLATDYVEVRKQMPSGLDRTRKMSSIASRFRSLAAPAYGLLPELVVSSSPGERLAAVCILQQVPSTKYLNWLAERVAVEKPLVGYQATVALLSAVRATRDVSRSEVAAVVKRARDFLTQLKWQDPNQVLTLENAGIELREDWRRKRDEQ
jgi:hypothetical protein